MLCAYEHNQLILSHTEKQHEVSSLAHDLLIIRWQSLACGVHFFSKYQDGNSKNKTLILSHQRFTSQWVITMTTPIFYIQSTIRPHISSLVLEECEASEFSLNIPPIANTANNNCRHQVLLTADKCD